MGGLEELKRCPFCDGEAKLMQFWSDDKEYNYYVTCKDCEATNKIVNFDLEAINAWNERAIENKILAQMEQIDNERTYKDYRPEVDYLGMLYQELEKLLDE